VCAAGAAETLKAEGHEVVGFFYNPNIYPAEEYHRRLEAAQRVARELNFPLEAETYLPQEWLRETDSLEDEQEGGKRCRVCFRLRLEKTYQHMTACGADAFTTTLTIGPRKSATIINAIGQEIGGDKFLVRDFKKKDGFKKAIQSARRWELYRQNYCGCKYSLRDSLACPPNKHLEVV
jgi:predicted adenine nucleotide alpha hydrolase (AANH) superfamily ATPase